MISLPEHMHDAKLHCEQWWCCRGDLCCSSCVQRPLGQKSVIMMTNAQFACIFGTVTLAVQSLQGFGYLSLVTLVSANCTLYLSNDEHLSYWPQWEHLVASVQHIQVVSVTNLWWVLQKSPFQYVVYDSNYEMDILCLLFRVLWIVTLVKLTLCQGHVTRLGIAGTHLMSA